MLLLSQPSARLCSPNTWRTRWRLPGSRGTPHSFLSISVERLAGGDVAGLENAAIYGRFGSPAEVLDPELCRFSDAGNDEARQTLGGRRLKSAKARNRGMWGTVSVPRALWGFSGAVRLKRFDRSARPNRSAWQDGSG
jgi:hypothetical protein